MTADIATNPDARRDHPRRQASLALLMGFVAVIALGLAGMKVATEPAAQLAMFAALVSLLVGTLGAIVRRRRGAWVGFALFGWAYTALALGIPILTLTMQNAGSLWNFWLVATPVSYAIGPMHPEVPYMYPATVAYNIKRVGDRYYSTVPPGEERHFSAEDAKVVDAYLDFAPRYQAWQDASYNALRVGLSIQGIAFALCGAVAGHRLDDRSTSAETSTESRTPRPLG